MKAHRRKSDYHLEVGNSHNRYMVKCNWERTAMMMGMGVLESCVQKERREVLIAMKMNGNMQLYVLRSVGYLQDETET